MSARVPLRILKGCLPPGRPPCAPVKLIYAREAFRDPPDGGRISAREFSSVAQYPFDRSAKYRTVQRQPLLVPFSVGERTALGAFLRPQPVRLRRLPCTQISLQFGTAAAAKSTAVVRVWNPQDEVAVIPESGIPIKPKTRLTPLGILLVLMPVVTFGLGVWQMYRLGWKLRLIQELEDRLELPIVRLPKIISDRTFENLQFRRVYVTGKFLHDRELHLGPRPKDDLGTGYDIITPLRREDGQIIMVKRGWVPKWRKNMVNRPLSLDGESQNSDVVRIVGILRKGEIGNPFTPKSNPRHNEWYKLDLEAMAKHCAAEPILVEQLTKTEPTRADTIMHTNKGVPLAAVASVDVRNTHLQYATTWFGISFFTSIALYLLMRRPRRAALYG